VGGPFTLAAFSIPHSTLFDRDKLFFLSNNVECGIENALGLLVTLSLEDLLNVE
jgi:hypothetical protein